MLKKYRVIFISLVSLTLLLVLTAAAFYLSVRSGAQKTPIRHVDLKPFHSLKIIDRSGALLQEVRCRDGRSSPVRLKNISPHFIRAVIATEDRRFYEHGGVDWRAVVRALTMNIFTGHRRSGASTITLQLAKMLEPGKRTFRKKIGEVKLAYRIEAGMSKEEILEQYLSRLPFGNQLFGVESASQTYFRKRAADLSLAQATFLAALPNAPSELNPYNNPKIGTARQIFILKRMESLRYITPESGRLALKERLEIQKPLRPRTAPHFIQRLLASVAQDVTLVKTTLDARLQESVEHQIKDVIRELKGRVVTNAAVLVLNNHTGEVLAYAGSADFESADNEGQNDGVQALRQPGSALKPFIYGLALERGMTPATVIEDLEVHFATPVGDFSPRNYSKQFHGPVRLREALANSLNVPAVRVTSELGPDAVLERLREFGFDSLDADAEHYGVGLALGDGEVSLYELTRAYMFLARGGIPIQSKEIIKTQISATESGRQGKKPEAVEKRNTLLATKAQRREGERETGKDLSNMRISTSEAVYLITDILKDPYARATEFGTDSVLRMPFSCAVKTGTSRNYRDNWAVGYTRDYTVGVWAGNFNGVPMQQVAGVTGAGPLFRRVMVLLHDRKEPRDFDRPKGLVEVEVCALSGKRRGPACPQGVKELFLLQDIEGKAMEPCDMHRKLTVHAASGAVALSAQNGDEVEERIFEDLPPIYEPWQRETGRPAVPRERSLHARSAAFEVIRPAKGAVYKRPLDLAPEYQTIRFEAVGSPAGSTVVWSLNGSEIGRTVSPHFLDWRAQAGEYRLRADAAGAYDEVRFIVE
ncbi:MAG: penicillin-binding protein 1C [Nitrospirota bacterium]